MSEVSRAITERLKQCDWNQKRLAHEWQEKVGTGSPSTFESQLSRLVNDEDAGFAFVLESKKGDDRLGALAALLGRTPEDLRAKCEAARARPKLVLHPALPEEQVAFLRRREVMFPDRLHCVGCNGAAKLDKPREHLRDLARKAGPNTYVVVPDDTDREFYMGADVRTTRVYAARPGFKLAELPDLTPELPPRLQDEDGMMMIPSEPTAARYRERMESVRRAGQWDRVETIQDYEQRWIDRIEEADEAGTPVTFRVDWLLEAWGGQAPKPAELQELALSMATASLKARPAEHLSREKVPGWVWLHGRQVMAMCPPDDMRRNAIAAHHSIHDVGSFEPLVAALGRICRGMNPRAEGGAFDLSAEIRAFEEETGIALVFEVASVRKAVASLHTLGKRVEGHPVRRSSEADAKVRVLIDELLGREFIVPEGKEPVLFELEAAGRAPLIHLESRNGNVAVIANVGAGRLLELRIWTYPDEKAEAVRYWEAERSYGRGEGIYDGGNVCVTVAERDVRRALEGTVLRSVGRRREEEEATRDDD